MPDFNFDFNWIDIIGLSVLFLLWAYLISATKRAGVNAWRFLIGSMGCFVTGIIAIRPFAIKYINYVLAAIVGIFGNITGWYQTIFRESAVFITTDVGGFLLQIDVECSGIIEILAFLSLLIFFDVYTKKQKLVYGIIGTLYIIAANAIRIIVISCIVRFCGQGSYEVAHTYIGRLLFYGLSVAMYFYVFTAPQIRSMKIGSFSYDKKKEENEHITADN